MEAEVAGHLPPTLPPDALSACGSDETYNAVRLANALARRDDVQATGQCGDRYGSWLSVEKVSQPSSRSFSWWRSTARCWAKSSSCRIRYVAT